jgi:eukaryotic-like serine/threonine-protein kinase
VHRDVKPHNFVLTTVDGHQRWKLVDFGIAKIDDGARLTGDLIIGTPAYMGPEQLAGEPADARSDLYSLCLVLYRAIAGRPAFTANRISERTSHPPDPYALALEGIPLDVCHVIRIGVSSVPSDRFASASELESAIEAAFAGRLDDGLRERAGALRLREPWV